MSSRRALVIGGSGFTGSRVLARAGADWEIFGLARSEKASESVKQNGAEPILGDLDEPATVAAVLKQCAPGVVIITASLGFGHAPSLVETLEAYGPDRVVFTSTTGIFTRLNPASKQIRLDAEQTIKDSSLDWTILRPTMIYGRPGDRNMERLLRYLATVPILPAPNGGKNLQQPVHVDDLAEAMWSAAVSPDCSGQALNVPGPEAIEFRSIVQLAARAVGRAGRVVPAPVGPLRQLVRLRERVDIGPKITVEQIDRLLEDKSFGLAPAAGLLGFSPRSFEEGISSESALLKGCK